MICGTIACYDMQELGFLVKACDCTNFIDRYRCYYHIEITT